MSWNHGFNMTRSPAGTVTVPFGVVDVQLHLDPGQRDGLNRTAHDIALMRGFVDIAQAFGPTQPAPSLARFLRPPA